MANEVDVVVVGGRIAGCLTAIRLAAHAARQAEAFVEAFRTSPDDWQHAYARLRRERTYSGFEIMTRLATDLRKLLE